MTADWDGKIRMDCSSPYAMTRLIGLRDRFDLAIGNDTDADRHGIVTPSGGLMKPNHYLAAAISYLFDHRPAWEARCGIGKTMVSSAMIDRVAARLGRRLVEVPVGFKWFVDGLFTGALGFAGEESAGASLLRRDGSVWTTDKDGLALGLLAAEIKARSGRDPGQVYDGLTAELGQSWYERIDAPATPQQADVLRKVSTDRIHATELAGRADRDQIDRRAWRRRPVRRNQDLGRKRLVRSASVRHRGDLQDLCGELSKRRPSERDPGGREGNDRKPPWRIDQRDRRRRTV